MILKSKITFGRLRSCTYVVFLFFGLTFASYLYGAGDGNTFSKSILPDEAVQAEIEQIVSLLSDSKNFSSKEEVWRVIDNFMSFRVKKVGDLFLQVLLSYGGKVEYLENPMSEMTKRLMINRFIKKIPADNLVELIVPHYEKSTDPILKKILRMSLDMVTYKMGSIEPDFSEYTVYIEKCKKSPPHSLIKYMYRIQPDKVLAIMFRIYSGEDDAKKLNTIMKEIQ